MTRTILLVDDDPQYRLLLKAKLESFDYKVLEAVNGEDALQVLNKSIEMIDLVILDLAMPEMDGLTFYYHFKKSLERDIPIFVLSNLSTTAYPSDIKHYFVKTNVSLNDLSQKIKDFFSGVV